MASLCELFDDKRVHKIEAGKFYSPSEAVNLAKETGSKKFDSTVEVALLS